MQNKRWHLWLGRGWGRQGLAVAGKGSANKEKNLGVHLKDHLAGMRILSGGRVRWGEMLKISPRWCKNGLFELRGKCTFSTLEDALLLVWSVTCVAVSLNPSVLSASLLGGSTSDVPGGGHAGICHQQGAQEQGPRKNWDSNRSWLAGVMSLATSYSLPEWVIMACCSFATAESGRIKSFANMADEALGFLEKWHSVTAGETEASTYEFFLYISASCW